MNTKSTIIKILLFPFSILYRMVVAVRNWLFNIGALRIHQFEVPIISVGNITVGGTGKTPATEYLVELLQSKMKVGVLSRGYKRKSRGYVLASQNPSPLEIGDEACQIKNKFPETIVAVDKNREHGIRKMKKEKDTKLGVIILDDAFQYRAVEPDVSILLMDYNRPAMEDYLLPLGQLREPLKSLKRAHIVIVTKCPQDITPMDMRIMTKKLNLYPYQTLYFTTVAYGEPIAVFPQKSNQTPDFSNKTALALSGIAVPAPFEKYLQKQAKEIVQLRFSDHHNFSQKDLMKIEKKFNDIPNPDKVIITTEKDATRLRSHPGFPESLKNKIYYIPLTIRFLQDQEKSFNKQIYDYVGRRKRGARLF